ncbi:MAG: ABC transporter ATP-binding protein [Dehalococcoidia bacterium]|nr:MAG: ABC transporter ATP-binding protein [Dehalococcoidia bacterium]
MTLAADGSVVDLPAHLRVDNVVSGYGQIMAIKGISLHVETGEIVALIGANGAGKSTTLRTVSGLIRPRSGEIWFEDRRIDRVPPHQIVALGVSQAPEGRKIFGRLTVMENLQLGAYQRHSAGEIADDLERVLTLFPRLRERTRQDGGTLSGGEQQMLAIARALMARPRLLLLDEPSMGLSPVLVETIFRTIIEINRSGTTILLVEQNAAMALQVASRGYVMESGVVTLHAPAKELAASDAVRKTYLGE